ncbi:protein kinase [bacterium]|nr:protein kinase [bacterium]
MLAIGTQFGKYRIEGELGRGANGIAFRAYDAEHGQPVALKLLSEERIRSPEFRTQLAEEAILTARVDSPFVVKVIEHDEIDGQPYIAMEFVAGKELRDACQSMELDQRLAVLAKVARGILAAHEVGLIHRDLKPENIRLTEAGDPKILDFGLAQVADTEEVDEFGDVEGTLYYLSPEQIAGEPLNHATDIFSFGTICYEVLTGRRPFEGAYAAAIIYSILHEHPESPSEVEPSLPSWTDTLVMKALTKKPEERFEDVRALVTFFESCLRGELPGGVAAVAAKETVTVVELKNLSNDESWDYFCEGFTDDVISEIARRTDLVVSAEPATTFKRDIRETFAKCRSDYVLVGSLLKFQEQLQLKLTLYGSDGDAVVWSEKYQESTANLFDLLSRAATDASTALARATSSSVAAVGEDLRADVSAYDFYLKGKSYYQTNKPDDLEFAASMYSRALEVDDRFALAHAGLADVYAFQYMAFYDRTVERIEAARKEALRAIELDPKLPEAHRSLARYYMFTGQPRKAEASLLKAVELNPKYAIGYRTLAWLERGMGDDETANAYARRALELAPTDLETLLLLGMIAMNQGKHTLAVATLQRAIELGPDYGRAYYVLGQVYVKLGALDPALENFVLAIKYKGDPNAHLDCGFVLLMGGHHDKAREKFEESVQLGFFPFVAEYYLGLNELCAGNRVRARQYFDRALNKMQSFDRGKPENIPVLAYQALAMAGSGRVETARELLDWIAEQEELNGEVLYNVACGYALLGKRMTSAGILQRALKVVAAPTEKQIALDPHFTLVGIAVEMSQ